MGKRQFLLRQQAKSVTGLGEEVSVDSPMCGEKNKRRASVLQEGRSVFCINPKCKASWKVRKQGDEFFFEDETADFPCQGCGEMNHLPWRFFLEMRYGQQATFLCRECGQKNYAEWRLKQVARGGCRRTRPNLDVQ